MTATLTTVDASDMLGAIHSLPDQLRETWGSAAILASTNIPARSTAPRALVVCGMGGSGVGGDLLAAVFHSACPVVPVKGYDLPAWVGADDAVVCVSYSGNTSETLACFVEAQARGAVAAVITSGGKLADLARDAGVPVLAAATGYQPRAAVGLLFATLVAVAERLRVVSNAALTVEEAAAGAERVVEQHRGVDGDTPGLELARQLHDHVVVVYGAGPTVAVAHRWKAQINENGKVPAFANAYPELDHNEIVGWEFARETGSRWALVELVAAGTCEEIRERMQITTELSSDVLDVTVRLEGESETVAGSAFELLAIGDYASVYLALLRGVDPSPVERIVALKDRLDGR